MGEQSISPNPNQNGVNENNDDIEMVENIVDVPEEQEEEEEEEMSSEDFQILNNQLDALNSVLDRIEQKNDSIRSELLVLLQSNRDIRIQLQNQSSIQDDSKP